MESVDKICISVTTQMETIEQYCSRFSRLIEVGLKTKVVIIYILRRKAIISVVIYLVLFHLSFVFVLFRFLLYCRCPCCCCRVIAKHCCGDGRDREFCQRGIVRAAV